MPQSNFQDVQEFQRKFVPDAVAAEPTILPQDVAEFRVGFMQEELDEFVDAYREAKQLAVAGELTESKRREAIAHMGDALIDLVYVALGTADMMGLPWQAMWAEVQRANMTKERAISAEQSALSTGRGHKFDIVKPAGWTGPDHLSILHIHMTPRTETGRIITEVKQP